LEAPRPSHRMQPDMIAKHDLIFVSLPQEVNVPTVILGVVILVSGAGTASESTRRLQCPLDALTSTTSLA
jgi:hypothetical protein